MKRTQYGWLNERLVFLFFLLVSLGIYLLPFLFMVLTSFTPSSDIAAARPTLWPQGFTLEHYRAVIALFDLPRHFVNSVIYSVGLTVISVVLNGLAAYAFAFLQFPGRERLFALLMMTLMVPFQVTILPIFLILKCFGLLSTLFGLILPGATSMFGVFLLRQFMLDLPQEIIDQARIDGCNELAMLWYIVLPLCRPIVATLAVFTFIAAWNDFLGPLIIMLRESGFPLPVALATLSNDPASTWGMLMAASLLTVIPGVAIFLLAQRHYFKGITAGAVR